MANTSHRCLLGPAAGPSASGFFSCWLSSARGPSVQSRWMICDLSAARQQHGQMLPSSHSTCGENLVAGGGEKVGEPQAFAC